VSVCLTARIVCVDINLRGDNNMGKKVVIGKPEQRRLLGKRVHRLECVKKMVEEK
jgi:hypothetical protein